MEDLTVIAQLLIKYSNMGTKEAVKELMQIDIIKNKYSKATIYNYICGTKAYIKEKLVHKAMNKTLITIIDKILKTTKEQQPKYTEAIKEKTIEEKIEEIYELKNKINSFAEQERTRLMNVIKSAERQIDLIEEVRCEELQKLHEELIELEKKQIRKKLCAY